MKEWHRKNNKTLIYQQNKASGEFDDSIASQFSGEVQTEIKNKQGKNGESKYDYRHKFNL